MKRIEKPNKHKRRTQKKAYCSVPGINREIFVKNELGIGLIFRPFYFNVTEAMLVYLDKETATTFSRWANLIWMKRKNFWRSHIGRVRMTSQLPCWVTKTKEPRPYWQRWWNVLVRKTKEYFINHHNEIYLEQAPSWSTKNTTMEFWTKPIAIQLQKQ